MPQSELRELFVDELKDLYSAEKQLVKALPKMAKAASSEELKSAFAEHLEQTKGHVQRLEEIFEALEESPRGKKCAGMEGLIKEGEEAIQEDYEGAVKDAALIGAAQRVEHYEIAAYGTAKALAEVIGESEHASTLEETLDEEKETDEKLTSISEQVNEEANSEPDAEEEEEEEPQAKRKTARGRR